jgi:hypothetical protein
MSPTRRASTVSSLRNAVEGGPPPTVTADPRATPTSSPYLNPEPPARPEKPIRFTLDLQRHQHRFLKQFAVEAEVDAARVMRVLLDHLRDDPELAQRVRADAWEQKTQ